MNNPIQNLIKEREKEFDKEFGDTGGLEEYFDSSSGLTALYDIHKFNSKTISLLLQEIVKMVEGNKYTDEHKAMNYDLTFLNYTPIEIYNQALEDINQVLKDTNK